MKHGNVRFQREAQQPRLLVLIKLLILSILISTGNLLRWVERGGKSYWFWLCSGRIAMVVLFGALALVAQFVYWAELVRGLNER